MSLMQAGRTRRRTAPGLWRRAAARLLEPPAGLLRRLAAYGAGRIARQYRRLDQAGEHWRDHDWI